jgi:hypothetical protein
MGIRRRNGAVLSVASSIGIDFQPAIEDAPEQGGIRMYPIWM